MAAWHIKTAVSCRNKPFIIFLVVCTSIGKCVVKVFQSTGCREIHHYQLVLLKPGSLAPENKFSFYLKVQVQKVFLLTLLK